MHSVTRTLLCFAALAGIATAAPAEQLKIYLRSGTGFFVNPDGYLVTNKHVVESCQRIMVEGAVSSRPVKLLAVDAEHDLALLKADATGFDVGQFRDTRMALAPRDRVVLVGYPGDAYKSHEPVTVEAKILSPTGPQGETKWLQLTDVVQLGNSGGPLFDTSGNIIGVVMAKAVIYTYHENAPQSGVTSNSGIAISAPTVESFLEQAGVRFGVSQADGFVSADNITNRARREIVNVRCEYKTERVP